MEKQDRADGDRDIGKQHELRCGVVDPAEIIIVEAKSRDHGHRGQMAFIALEDGSERRQRRLAKEPIYGFDHVSLRLPDLSDRMSVLHKVVAKRRNQGSKRANTMP